MNAPRNKYEWLERLWLLALSGERLRVLGAIQSAHRDDAALISVAEIVKLTGLSRSAVSRNLKAAERQKLVAVEWSRGGPKPHRITLLDPSQADLNCGASEPQLEEDELRPYSAAVQKGELRPYSAAVTAALTRARVSDTFHFGGDPLGVDPLKGMSSSELNMAVEPVDLAPDGALRAPGATDAPSLRNRIEKIDQEIDRLRNSDGDLPSGLPSSVGVFADRDFYGREEIETSDAVAEVEADLSDFRNGNWIGDADQWSDFESDAPDIDLQKPRRTA